MVSYDDAVVGAPKYDDGMDTEAGRIYVFEGGRIMDNVADQTREGEDAYDRFGYSVSNAGDVNGASEDVIVGAPYAEDFPRDNSGKAYIYTGSLFGLYGPPIATLEGENDGDKFGTSVSTAGNFNGDSYDDVIIGAPEWNDGSDLNVGKVYIYYGGSGTFDTTADHTFTGEAATDEFGHSVSEAWDVDNDGYDDVVIGAPNNDAGASNAGRVYIYYGASSADSREDVYMTGQSASEKLGSAVASAGDVNSDNYDDVATGAESWSSGRGKATVWGDPS
jgi:hypothetical protein